MNDLPLSFRLAAEPVTTILALILCAGILFAFIAPLVTDLGANIPVVSSWIRDGEQKGEREEAEWVARERQRDREAAIEALRAGSSPAR